MIDITIAETVLTILQIFMFLTHPHCASFCFSRSAFVSYRFTYQRP